MYVIMDMGTTNTRLYMCANNQVVDHVKGNFGASFGKRNGRLELCKRVGSLLNDLLEQRAVKECDIESIVALGMAGSEIGLLDIPHIFLPADAVFPDMLPPVLHSPSLPYLLRRKFQS